MSCAPAPRPGRVHALHGFIGSGKSTLARRLEAELPALRFTPDTWTNALLGADPPEALYRPALSALMPLFERQWRRAALLGLDVILDYGFWERAERDYLRALCHRSGLELRLYDLGGPPQELWRRVKRRNARVAAGQEPESVLIDASAFRSFYASFQPLQGDERSVSMPAAHPAAAARS